MHPLERLADLDLRSLVTSNKQVPTMRNIRTVQHSLQRRRDRRTARRLPSCIMGAGDLMDRRAVRRQGRGIGDSVA
jgi:hypothetical protein